MFGYIKPLTGELLVKESEQYKSVYCSLCKALGTYYGRIARMTLSYDCTFLALFSLGLQPACTGFHKGRCTCNPLKRCTFCTQNTEALHLPAALSVITMYYKLQDDRADKGFWKKVRAVCLMPLARRPFRKASRDYPALAEALAKMGQEQRAIEREASPSMDACAEPTAQMLSTVFRLLANTETEQRIFETIGYFLGKWIYGMDAADDLEDDLQKGAFNPLISKLELTKTAAPEALQQAKAYCNGTLNLCVSQLIASVRLVSFHHFGPIIRNIVEQGLPDMQRTLLFKKEKDT
ncbi:MAG: DUF5685 family protein [Oscillospiraceae bacterium]|nr:DUF5685 family protein [Oscillospiraceae bacterium]